MKRKLALIALAAVLTAAPRLPAERIKLRTCINVSQGSTDVMSRARLAVLKAFQEKYPDIEIESRQQLRLEGAASDAIPLMAIAGGVSPDIIYVNFRLSHSYIHRGFLYPLDEYMEELSEEEIDERIHPAVRPVVYREGPDGKKHWWTMPYRTAVIVLLYRKDLFDEAGLDPDRPPATWDELLDYARKIHDPDRGVYGIGLSREATVSWSWYSFLLSAGGRAVRQDENGRWLAAFEGDAAAVSAYFYLQLLQREYEKNGEIIRGCGLSASYHKLWEQGRLGMEFSYLTDDIISAVNPDLVGVAPVPLGPTGLRGSEINAMMMGMYAGIKDKRVRDAAWKFMNFWTGPEARRIRTQVYVSSGYAKFVNPEHLKKYGFEEYLELVPKGWFESYKAALNSGVPEPYGDKCGMVYRFMSDPLNKMRLENLGNKPYEEVKDRIKELLAEGVRKTNERMIGEIPPKVMARRRYVAGGMALVIFVVFFAVFRHLMRVFTPEEEESGKGWQFRKYMLAYILLIPAVGAIGLWRYVPLVRGALMAFQDYRILQPSRWVWLDNFAKILFDPIFWQALGCTLYYVMLKVGLGFLAPIVLAILLHEVPRGKILFRTLYYLPAVVTGLVVMFMWKNFFDDSKAGLLNQLYLSLNRYPLWLVVLMKCALWALVGLVLYNTARWFFKARSYEGNARILAAVCGPVLWVLLAYAIVSALMRYSGEGTNAVVALIRAMGSWTVSAWHLQPQGWLKDPKQAMICVVIPSVWAGMGPGCLIYLAALKTVSEDVYEAADLDGAGTLQKIRYITIPTIKPLIIIQLVGFTVSAFQTSGHILAMTGGGPMRATNVLGLEIFFQAFAFMEFGIATAMAWVLGLMLIGFTAYQMKRLSRMQFTAAGAKAK